MNNESFSLNFVELLDYQPNRYPFLFIDYVDEVVPGKFANGYKNLTLNEWFFLNISWSSKYAFIKDSTNAYHCNYNYTW